MVRFPCGGSVPSVPACRAGLDKELAGLDNGGMKTLELPDALMNELQNRAAEEGRDVQDIVAALLAAGTAHAEQAGSKGGRLVAKTLPLIKARPAQPADVVKLSTQEWCDWIKDVDLQLEVERYEKALGHQYVDRARD